VCVCVCVCVSSPQRELASELLDVVKVATVVKELSSQSFIYPPTTKFDYITDAFMSVESRFNDSDSNIKRQKDARQNNQRQSAVGCLYYVDVLHNSPKETVLLRRPSRASGLRLTFLFLIRPIS